MKAAVLYKHQDKLNVKHIDVPKPGNNEVLIQIHACGCCHTDVHAIDGDWPVASKLPLVCGHEGAGIVDEVGAGVDNLKVGDRVGIAWLHHSCGHCEYCVSGWETLCEQQGNTGYSTDGCMAEYSIGCASHVVKIPDNLSLVDAAPILCAGVTAYKGLKETEARPGQFVCIIGAAGGLGHLAIQYANAMGLRVIAMDIDQEKLEFCLSMGAEFAVNSTHATAQAEVQEITHGGSHGVLCLATNAAVFRLAVDVCRRRGCVVCVGLPKGCFDCPIFDVVLRRITIRGSIVGTRADLAEALDFAARGLVRCSIKTDSLDNINEVIDNLRCGIIEGRVVVQMVSSDKLDPLCGSSYAREGIV